MATIPSHPTTIAGIRGRGDLILPPWTLREPLYISLPLEDRDYQLGSLVLAKELPASSQLSSQILRRIELLRRTVTDTLQKLADSNKTTARHPEGTPKSNKV